MHFALRECIAEDIDIIYNMSNDPEVRENSFNTRKITYKEHCKWFEESLINKNRVLYIVEKDKIVIGQMRLDKQENKATISYSIKKDNRKKGYAKELLSLIKREAIVNKIEIVEGLVKKDNVASQKAFISSGFTESEEDSYYKYTYELRDGNKSEIDKNS